MTVALYFTRIMNIFNINLKNIFCYATLRRQVVIFCNRVIALHEQYGHALMYPGGQNGYFRCGKA